MSLSGIYRGEIKNGVPHGLGDYTYNDENDATNNIRIKGTWQDGVLISGEMTFGGGVEFHGTFHEDGDFKHGRMTNLGIDGNGWYEGDFVNGVRNGTGRLHEDGVLFTGTWKDDILHGKGTMELPNGTKYDGMWNDHHFDGSIMYSNGVNREFIGYLKHDGEKAVGHSEEMSVTDSHHHLTYEGDFEDNMPMHFGSVTWFGDFFNVTLPVFSHAFNSCCIVSPNQHKQLIEIGVLERQEDPISCDMIDGNTPLFYLFHFGLKLDQTADVQLWHPVKISMAMKLRSCPLCRLEYPQPLIGWVKREAQMNAATKIQRLVRSRTRTKKRASAATKIQRFVRSRAQNRNGGTKRGGTKRSGTNKRKNKRNAQRRC